MRVYEYIWKLQDKITGQINRITAAQDRVTSRFTRAQSAASKTFSSSIAGFGRMRAMGASAIDYVKGKGASLLSFVSRIQARISSIDFSMFRRRGTDAMNDVGRSAGRLDGVFNSLRRTIATVFAVGMLTAFSNNVVATTAKVQGLENAISFAVGGKAAGQQNLKWLRGLSKEMGLNVESSLEGFKTLSASMMGSKLQGEATQKIFKGVSTAVSAMSLSGEMAKGTYIALGQIMGKGKVQAEELRGQLGERIPGAFQIAARAMGVSTAKLDKMMEQGKLLAEDFLPRFAAELERTFEGALPDSINSLQANLNRAANAWFDLKTFIGEQELPFIQSVVTGYTGAVEWLMDHYTDIVNPIKRAFGELFATLEPLFDSVGRLFLAMFPAQEGVTRVQQFVGYVVSAVNLLRGPFEYISTVLSVVVDWIARNIQWIKWLVAMYGAWKLAMIAVNLVMAANPIGLVITAIGALVSAVIYLYQKFDWFRGGIWGLWEAFKEVFVSIADLVVNIFGGIWETISGLWNKDFGKAKAGLEKLGKGLMAANPVGLYQTYGKNVADKFKEGYANGLKDFDENSLLKKISGPQDAVNPAAAIPGADPAGVAGASGGPEAETSQGIDGITGGGQKSTVINIQTVKLSDNFEINVKELNEALPEVEDKFLETVIRALNGGMYAVGQ